jgi:hypothetical protein
LAYGRFANTKLACDGPLSFTGCKALPYDTHIACGELGPPMSFSPQTASHMRLPAFGTLVVHIVGCGADKQVGRIAARWVIAVVTHEHAFGNRFIA